MNAPAQTLGRMGLVYTIPEAEYEVPAGACEYCECRPCRCDEAEAAS